MNTDEYLAFQGQLKASREELVKLEREEKGLEILSEQAKYFADNVGEHLGRLSHEFYAAESLMLRVQHNRQLCSLRVDRMQAGIAQIEESLKD